MDCVDVQNPCEDKTAGKSFNLVFFMPFVQWHHIQLAHSSITWDKESIQYITKRNTIQFNLPYLDNLFLSHEEHRDTQE